MEWRPSLHSYTWACQLGDRISRVVALNHGLRIARCSPMRLHTKVNMRQTTLARDWTRVVLTIAFGLMAFQREAESVITTTKLPSRAIVAKRDVLSLPHTTEKTISRQDDMPTTPSTELPITTTEEPTTTTTTTTELPPTLDPTEMPEPTTTTTTTTTTRKPKSTKKPDTKSTTKRAKSTKRPKTTTTRKAKTTTTKGNVDGSSCGNAPDEENGYFPFYALVYLTAMPATLGSKFQSKCCNGLIVGEQFVLAPMSCLYSFEGTRFEEITVVISEDFWYDPFRPAGNSTDRIPGKLCPNFGFQVSHGWFGADSYQNDFALIYLKRPIKKSTNVSPVCLPTGNDADFRTCQRIGINCDNGQYLITRQSNIALIQCPNCANNFLSPKICTRQTYARRDGQSRCRSQGGRTSGSTRCLLKRPEQPGNIICKEGDKWAVYGLQSYYCSGKAIASDILGLSYYIRRDMDSCLATNEGIYRKDARSDL